MVYSLIEQNYAFIFLIVINLLLLSVNSMIEKKVRIIFYVILALEIIQCVFSIVPVYIGFSYSNYLINVFVSHINYAVRPALLFLILLISERNRSKKEKIIISLPLIITSFLLAVSIPTKILVYYTFPERTFCTGPLFPVTWIILLLYLLSIILSAFLSKKNITEIISLLISAFFIICNIVLELMEISIPGMQQTIIALSVLTYCLYFQSITYADYRIETEKALAKAQMQAMISQIKPHFIYNSLSCIAEICHEGSPEGENAILTFSGYLRSCLNSLEEDGLVPFSQELTTIQNYASLEILQSSGKLEMVYEISETGFRIPVLSIETLVENAVKHGIRSKRNGGTVTLRTQREDHHILIQIEDDGIGFDIASISNNPAHLGLSNARMRLEEQCKAKVDIQSHEGEGTKITIAIPEDNLK